MALQAVFPEEGGVKLSPVEHLTLESAQQVCIYETG